MTCINLHKPSCRQSIHPLEESLVGVQPVIPRRTLCLAVNQAPDFWQVPLILPFHTLSLQANLHGPVDLHATLHHSMMHFPAFSTVPADNRHNQRRCPLLATGHEGRGDLHELEGSEALRTFHLSARLFNDPFRHRVSLLSLMRTREATHKECIP